MGPLNETMKKEMREQQGDLKFDIEWTTLGEYLDYLAKRGVSCNVASFIGATTVRVHEVAYANRPPSPEELERMKTLVRQAMEDGALGVGSSLIYAPAFYAKTDELIALCKVAAEYNGRYISHIRSEGNRLLEGADELIDIARAARIPAEFYSSQSGRQTELEQARQPASENRGRARPGPEHQRRHVHLHGGRHRPGCHDAALGPGRGLKNGSSALKTRHPRTVKREMATPTDAWETFSSPPGRPKTSSWSVSKTKNSSPSPGRPLLRSQKCGRPPGGKPPWTWSSKTTGAWTRFIS